MGVSGEFRYFGPDFSSAASVRPVKAMTLPASLEIGNMTRLRNLEYMEAASGFRLPASGTSRSPPCPSKVRTDKDGAPADPRSLDSARDDNVEGATSFQENRPLSRRTSSVNSSFWR